MNITVDKNRKLPLYLQIAGQISNMIFSGQLVNGAGLPSERSLAGNLKVHRNTVIRAYAELKAAGLVESSQGKGYRVCYESLFQGIVRKPVNWETLIKESYVDFRTRFDDLFNQSYRETLISFGGGIAARELYPRKEATAVFGKVLKDGIDRTGSVTPWQGNPELRKEIAAFLNARGILVRPSNIQMFSGNIQALDFILTLMLSEGDKVIVPEALSPDISRAILYAGGELVTVPMDEDGMICEGLDACVEKEKPRFIYADSSFNNPTGTVLSLERRRKLLELSYRYRIPIIEEDEGSELYYDTDHIPSIRSMDPGNNVLYLYSFSLTMMPGMEISFAAADTGVIRRLSELTSLKISSPDWIRQMLLLEYMRQGIFYERLDGFRKVCKRKRDLMCRCLEEIAGYADIEYRRPDGGVYIWVKLPAGLDAHTLLREAQKEHVTFMPGNLFYPGKHRGNDYIRLNFSYPTTEEISTGMQKLGELLKKNDAAIPKISV